MPDIDAPIFPPGHPDAPPTPVEKPPPGMAWGITATGERALTYIELPTPPPAPAQPDVWPKRLAAGGGSLAAILAAVGWAGPGMMQAGHAVEMAGVGVGVAAASVGGMVLLVKGSIGRQPGQNVHVNVNVTNTSTSSARSSSRSGRRR